jgi:hypothetical protein
MTSFEDRAQAVRADRDSASRTVTLLPDPDRQRRYYTLISVDDHIVEPPDAFEGRLPTKLAERGPRVIKRADGLETWLYDGIELPNIGFNAVAGRPLEEMSYEPTRFEDMRRGSWDIKARLHDMDLDGVYASLNFPSFLPGFAGIRMQTITKDQELAFASIRAWNDWHIESWAARSEGWRRDGARERTPWLQGAELSGSDREGRVSFHPHPALGPALGRVRGDRDASVRSHRIGRDATAHRARCAA